jgi:hypothetical protein
MAKTLEEIQKEFEKNLRGPCGDWNGFYYAIKDILDYLIEKDKYPEGKLTDK